MDIKFGFGQIEQGEKQRVFALTSNYLQYFSESNASGYFAELFGMIQNQQKTSL